MNKFKTAAYMFLMWAVFTTGGCSGKNQMYLEAKEQEMPSGERHESAAVDETAAEVPPAVSDDDTCFVYICGAVRKPGVFEVPAGSRIYEVITLAGGLKKNASVKGLNQAQQVADGDMVEILTVKEQREADKEEVTAVAGDTGNSVNGLVDLNTASAAELMTLNGIGEAKAAGIIAYREENGKFSATEELMNVSGIGEGIYAQIKDKITVTN